MCEQYGKLYIVATPIGNLQDITFRAIRTLKEVDVIACEDTRHTKELLNHFDIKTKLISYHKYNEYERSDGIIELLMEGKNVAIVTDAGTPVISDPGNILVRRCVIFGIIVTAIPGACAAINALVVSGMDARSFIFIGFLSDDNKVRKEQLATLIDDTRTMVFYVSPHSFIKDIDCLIDTFGMDRMASVSREMTKIHEENIRGSLKEIKEHFENTAIRGEFVLVVEGKDKNKLADEIKSKWLSISLDEHLKLYTDKGLSEKDAMKKIASDRGVDKREIYKALKVKE